MTYERERSVALDACRLAALLCEDVRRELVGTALTKEDRSPVTVADFGAQALICRRLAEEFPGDPIVAEEDSAALAKPDGQEALTRVTTYARRYAAGATGETVRRWIDLGNGSVSRRYWTLDPIDGTKGFLRGDQYAIALALIEEGDLKVGALACPHLPVDALNGTGERGLLFSAVRGQGAFVQKLSGGRPIPIEVAKDGASAGFRMVESVESNHSNHSLQERVASSVGMTARPFRMDSQAKYGAVARGDAALYLRLPSPRTPEYRENIWDHAAGVLVVEEAGGRVTDLRGAALDFTSGPRMLKNRGIVVSNGSIHDRVLEELAGIF
jgi:3'(2'), 5'-bisphosphate nucleotidase